MARPKTKGPTANKRVEILMYESELSDLDAIVERMYQNDRLAGVSGPPLSRAEVIKMAIHKLIKEHTPMSKDNEFAQYFESTNNPNWPEVKEGTDFSSYMQALRQASIKEAEARGYQLINEQSPNCGACMVATCQGYEAAKAMAAEYGLDNRWFNKPKSFWAELETHQEKEAIIGLFGDDRTDRDGTGEETRYWILIGWCPPSFLGSEGRRPPHLF